MIRIGVDIGGAYIKFVVLDQQKIIKSFKQETVYTQVEMIDLIQNQLLLVKKEYSLKNSVNISGVGIGVPGILKKPSREVLINTPNLSFLINCPLATIISQKIGLKVVMENDANCFTLAEAVMGSGKKARILMGLVLGTGFGGGIVQRKLNKEKNKLQAEIYQGAFGGAGEVGHMIIEKDGLQCSCGNYGCLEEYASEKFIKRKSGYSSQELLQRANQGDQSALAIYQELGVNLGYGLGTVINILDPEMIVIGGGLIYAADFFFEVAVQTAKTTTLSTLSKTKVQIKKSVLGEFAGAIGASLIV